MSLTADDIKGAAKTFDLECVTRISLQQRGLRDVDALALCPNLASACVEGNKVRDG